MTNYRGFRITEIHAVTSIGDDDEEAIPAFMSADGPVPMISSDRVRLEQLKQMAQFVADRTGKNFKIVKFSAREDVGEIKSRRSN